MSQAKYWFQSPKGMSYRCAYCGEKTGMQPYLTTNSKNIQVFWPSCCIEEECTDQWASWEVHDQPLQPLPADGPRAIPFSLDMFQSAETLIDSPSLAKRECTRCKGTGMRQVDSKNPGYGWVFCDC